MKYIMTSNWFLGISYGYLSKITPVDATSVFQYKIKVKYYEIRKLRISITSTRQNSTHHNKKKTLFSDSSINPSIAIY